MTEQSEIENRKSKMDGIPQHVLGTSGQGDSIEK
jgi:hypothetical protein